MISTFPRATNPVRGRHRDASVCRRAVYVTNPNPTPTLNTHSSNCAWSLSELTKMNSTSSPPALFLSSSYVFTKRGVKARQGGHLPTQPGHQAIKASLVVTHHLLS